MDVVKKRLFTKDAVILLLVGIIILLVGILYFQHSYRVFRRTPHIVKLANENSIADWMTVRYVAIAYSVPEQVLLNAAHISETQARHQSILAIAKSQGKSAAQVITELKTAITQYKALHSPAAPGSTTLP